MENVDDIRALLLAASGGTAGAIDAGSKLNTVAKRVASAATPGEAFALRTMAEQLPSHASSGMYQSAARQLGKTRAGLRDSVSSPNKRVKAVVDLRPEVVDGSGRVQARPVEMNVKAKGDVATRQIRPSKLAAGATAYNSAARKALLAGVLRGTGAGLALELAGRGGYALGEKLNDKYKLSERILDAVME